MKYLAFFTLLFVTLPIMTLAASSSARARSWLVTALIFSTAVGDMANINFVSWEFYRGPDRGFEVNLADLIAWSLVPALVLLNPGRARYLPYNSGWMAMFFALATITCFTVDQPLFTAFTLFKLAKLYVIYWCVVNAFAQGVPIVAVWRAALAIGVAIITLSVWQKYGQGMFRVRGTFDHANGIPLYLHLLMPFLLLWALSDREPERWPAMLSIGVALGMLFVVVSTQSRAGQVLMTINLVLALLWANKRARPRQRRRVRWISLAVLLLIGLGGVKAIDSVIERFETAPENSWVARIELNQAARLMLDDHPILGVGLNQYSHVATITPEYTSHMTVLAADLQQGVAHHIYLLTAAEMGYPGLIVFLVIMGRFLWISFRHAWRRGSRNSLLLLGCLLGAGAVHLQGLLEWGLRVSAVIYLLMIMSAVSVALADRVRREDALARRTSC